VGGHNLRGPGAGAGGAGLGGGAPRRRGAAAGRGGRLGVGPPAGPAGGCARRRSAGGAVDSWRAPGLRRRTGGGAGRHARRGSACVPWASPAEDTCRRVPTLVISSHVIAPLRGRGPLALVIARLTRSRLGLSPAPSALPAPGRGRGSAGPHPCHLVPLPSSSSSWEPWAPTALCPGPALTTGLASPRPRVSEARDAALGPGGRQGGGGPRRAGRRPSVQPFRLSAAKLQARLGAAALPCLLRPPRL
jgi:hypothetical protein